MKLKWTLVFFVLIQSHLRAQDPINFVMDAGSSLSSGITISNNSLIGDIGVGYEVSRGTYFGFSFNNILSESEPADEPSILLSPIFMMGSINKVSLFPDRSGGIVTSLSIIRRSVPKYEGSVYVVAFTGTPVKFLPLRGDSYYSLTSLSFSGSVPFGHLTKGHSYNLQTAATKQILMFTLIPQITIVKSLFNDSSFVFNLWYGPTFSQEDGFDDVFGTGVYLYFH